MVPITQLRAMTMESLADVVCWDWPTEWVEVRKRWHLRVDRARAPGFQPVSPIAPLADESFARRFLHLDGSVDAYKEFFTRLGHPLAPVGTTEMDPAPINLALSIDDGQLRTFHMKLRFVMDVSDALATDARRARDFLPRFGPEKGEWQLEHDLGFASMWHRTTPEQVAKVAAVPERDRPLMALQLFVDDVLAQLFKEARVALRVQSDFVPGRGHQRQTVALPANLLSAILLQCLGAIDAGDRWVTCVECRTPFNATGRNRNKILCDDPNCRQRRRRGGRATPRARR